MGAVRCVSMRRDRPRSSLDPDSAEMSLKPFFRSAALAATILTVVACSNHESSSNTVSASAGGEVVAASSARAPAFRLVVEQPGNEVRYRVRERLVGKE